MVTIGVGIPCGSAIPKIFDPHLSITSSLLQFAEVSNKVVSHTLRQSRTSSSLPCPNLGVKKEKFCLNLGTLEFWLFFSVIRNYNE